MMRLLVSTPSSTEDRRPQVANLDDEPGAFELASIHAEKIEKNVGDDTTTTSAGPVRRRPRSTLVNMIERCPRDFFREPSFGVAYNHVRTTR